MHIRTTLNTINRRKFLILALQSTTAAALTRKDGWQSPQFSTPSQNLEGNWAFQPNSALPNVLLLGDSISIGYTLDVRKLLHGVANVYRPMRPNGKPDNCGDTSYGLEHIHEWLGNGKWSVIHFNWGLWDLCYRNPESKVQGHRDKHNGVQDVPIAQYKINLEKLVEILEKTGAELIWANTTMVPRDEAGRFYGNEVVYNEMADLVMRNHHIKTDDLYTLTKQLPASSHLAPGNVHYKDEGYERIAVQVASVIRNSLHR